MNQSRKEKHREACEKWRGENKDYIKSKNQEYYSANRNTLLKKRGE